VDFDASDLDAKDSQTVVVTGQHTNAQPLRVTWFQLAAQSGTPAVRQAVARIVARYGSGFAAYFAK
jgi:hypothetical protein